MRFDLARVMRGAGILLSITLFHVNFTHAREAGETFRDCPDCPLMVVVPGGSFEMGYEPVEDHPETDAAPAHRVTLARDFAVGAFEVTRNEFGRFVAAADHAAIDECNIYELEDTGWWFVSKGVGWRNPGFAQTENDPVVCVRWTDAQAYVAWLSRTTGHRYRLLSEAEWEYIAKIGGKAYGGDEVGHDFANYGAAECCGPRREGRDEWDFSAPAGSFPPDSLGLFDVRGNVWEWLADCYHEDYSGAPSDGAARTANCSAPESRVVRGGGWGDDLFYLRAAYRLRAPRDNGYFTLGFRVARDLAVENGEQRRLGER